MKNYITVDGGTTNTRIYLVQNNQLVQSVKLNMGAKDNNDELLWTKITDSAEVLLKNNRLDFADITAVLVSGMITRKVPHILLPVGITELKENLFKSEFSILNIPTFFIRGVKTEKDMMRGEETELYGISNGESGVYILPGSHSKIVITKDGKIEDIKTMMTGEMAASLSQHTILKESVDLTTNKIDKPYLVAGCECCRKNGINHALFKVRILSVLERKNPSQIYSFFMGVILCDEICEIAKLNPQSITIAGKKDLLDPMVVLLKNAVDCHIKVIYDTFSFSAAGAIKIFEG